MSDVSGALVDAQLLTLGVGLALATAADARTREVPDRLWQIAAGLGAALGAGLLVSDGPGPVLVWLLVAGFALQHLFPWDERWDGGSSRLPGIIETVLYVGTGAILFGAGWAYGLGGDGVPIAALALYGTVLLARGLFELRALYGGADAKAVITVGILLPLWSTPFVGQVPTLSAVMAVVPFALTALIDAAVLALLVPIALAIRNGRRREFSFPKGFLGMYIPTEQLAVRYVSLYHPRWEGGRAPEEPDTSEQDRELRVRQAADLREQGIGRVWVVPQIPLVLFLALGAGVALLFGNIVLDLVALL